MKHQDPKCGGMGLYVGAVSMPINGKVRMIDRCVHGIVAALNAGGVDTVACCCGHGDATGRIDLKDGRILWIGSSEEQLKEASGDGNAPGFCINDDDSDEGLDSILFKEDPMIHTRERLLDSLVDDLKASLEEEIAAHAITRRTLEQCKNMLSATSRENEAMRESIRLTASQVVAMSESAEKWRRIIRNGER